MGRSKEGIAVQSMHSIRAEYHRAIRNVIKKENDITKERLVERLLGISTRDC